MTQRTKSGAIRTRWAAIGAAVAVTLGGGAIGLVTAAEPSSSPQVRVPITPCRILDVRADSQIGVSDTPLGPGETVTVAAHGANGECADIPADAVALSLNVTAVEATLPTFLTIWSAGTDRPETSSLNPAPGQPPTPNAVTTQLSPTGEFNIYNLQGSVEVIVDVDGYFVSSDQANAPDTIRRGILDFEPTVPGSAWTRTFVYTHSGGEDECIASPVDPVSGQTVAAVTATYQNTTATPQNISVALAGVRTTPGEFTPPPDLVHIHTAADVTTEVPPSPTDQMEEVASDVLDDALIRDDHRYAVVICSAGDLNVLGANITLTGP